MGEILSDVYVVPHATNIKSASDNNGSFDTNNPDIYAQSFTNNPNVSHAHFNNPTSEQAFRNALKGNTPVSRWQSIKHSTRDFIHGLKGDLPQLATPEAKAKGLVFAREVLRKMNRQTEAATMAALDSLGTALKNMDTEQLNIFGRLMLLNDIYQFKKFNPKAKLPLGFTPASLKAEREKFVALARKDQRILQAIND